MEIFMYYEVGKTAKIIKNLRKESGKTQEIIAEGTGINIKTYQAAEQGTRGVSIDTLCIIASYFQVTLDYLITGVKANNDRVDPKGACVGVNGFRIKQINK